MQISVATYVSDRPIFRQNAQKPQGVPWGGSLVGCGLLAVSTCRKPNTGCNHPATGMGVVRDNPTQKPYLRGQDRITLYRTPSLWNSNSRSGLMMLNSSRPNSRNPSIIAEHSSSFSGLGLDSMWMCGDKLGRPFEILHRYRRDQHGRCCRYGDEQW